MMLRECIFDSPVRACFKSLNQIMMSGGAGIWRGGEKIFQTLPQINGTAIPKYEREYPVSEPTHRKHATDTNTKQSILIPQLLFAHKITLKRFLGDIWLWRDIE